MLLFSLLLILLLLIFLPRNQKYTSKDGFILFFAQCFFPIEMQPSAGNYVTVLSNTTAIMYNLWLYLKLLTAEH